MDRTQMELAGCLRSARRRIDAVLDAFERGDLHAPEFAYGSISRTSGLMTESRHLCDTLMRSRDSRWDQDLPGQQDLPGISMEGFGGVNS